MRELTLRVGATDLDEALDAILPALPGGVHLREQGDAVEVAILATPGTPSEEDLRGLVGGRLLGLSASEVSEDWRERRLGRYEPLLAGGRFLIRPDWAPPSESPDRIEIVLAESSAFGTGVHPTTSACLSALAGAEPGGSLVDCGCGSGILSIAAAKLGWEPVTAVDVNEPTLAAARGNATANEVEVEVRRLDLTREPPPPAQTLLANVPPDLQLDLAVAIESRPRLAIVSGFAVEDVDRVAEAWGAVGLEVAGEERVMEWSTLVLR